MKTSSQKILIYLLIFSNIIVNSQRTKDPFNCSQYSHNRTLCELNKPCKNCGFYYDHKDNQCYNPNDYCCARANEGYSELCDLKSSKPKCCNSGDQSHRCCAINDTCCYNPIYNYARVTCCPSHTTECCVGGGSYGGSVCCPMGTCCGTYGVAGGKCCRVNYHCCGGSNYANFRWCCPKKEFCESCNNEFLNQTFCKDVLHCVIAENPIN